MEEDNTKYKELYIKYKAKYIDAKYLLTTLKKWPQLSCDNYFTDVVDADNCILDSIYIKENPYYETDKINGYTNNGFFKYWGDKPIIFNNVKYCEVKTADDISKILKHINKFKEKIKVIVKNTGHDYQGRSFPSDNTIVIWTHKMTNIYWESKKYIIDENNISCKKKNKNMMKKPNFGCKLPNIYLPNYDDGYLNVSAGVQWYKVFDYMMKHPNTENKSLIDDWAMKGASNTVGAAGGWILDGGFGLFPKLNGMGVDNVICMTIVLADSSIKTISKCNEPDLFRAFRGGGGCNFGIVVDVTYKLLPKLETFGDIFIKITSTSDEQFKKTLNVLFKSKFLIQKYFGGTIQIRQNLIELFIQFANLSFEKAKQYQEEFNNMLKKDADINFDSIIQKDDITLPTSDIHNYGVKCSSTLVMQPNSTFIESHNPSKNNKFGTPSSKRWWNYESYNDHIVAFGSRYLSIDDVNKPEECAQKFIDILNAGAPMIQLEISKGMYGADENILKENSLTSVHPEVRKAVGLVYIRSYLENFRPNTYQIVPYVNIKKIKEDIDYYNNEINRLKQIDSLDSLDAQSPINENLIQQYEKNIQLILEKIKKQKEFLNSIRFKYDTNKRIFGDQHAKKLDELLNITDEKEQAIKIKEYFIKGSELSREKTMNGINKMRETFISNATYINHSDCDEPNWQTTFWDETTFKFLVSIKKKYDPNNMFNHRYSIPTEY
jgi:FAD/FMN-containing dehydrogenase